nr:hypothetical protein [Angustibacter aerolatus]
MVSAVNTYLSDQAPWKAEGRPRPDGDRAALRGAGDQRLPAAAVAVPAVQRAGGARGLRRHRRGVADAAGARGRRPRRRPRVPDPDRRLLDAAAVGVDAGRRRHAGRPAGARVHQGSTPPWSTTSLARLAERAQ